MIKIHIIQPYRCGTGTNRNEKRIPQNFPFFLIKRKGKPESPPFPSPKFSFVPFQKVNIIPILNRGFLIIIQEQLIQFLWDLLRTGSFKDSQIPGMLALSAPVNQPDIHIIPIRIHSESAGVDKFLLFTAAPAPVIYLHRMYFRFHPCFRRL